MELEIKSESLAEDGSFEGYAAVFGNVDSQGDRIEPGAFSQSGEAVPLLWAHKRDEVIGTIQLTADEKGVIGKGRLLLDTAAGREAYVRLKAGATKGLSVGIRILKHVRDGAVRVIQALSVAEVSLTPFPANPGAQVLAVKQQEDCPLRELAKLL